MGYIRFIIRAPLVILCILTTLLLMSLCSALGMRSANRKLMRTSFIVGTVLLNIRITQQGTLSPKRPLLLVSNHFSYLDLFAIGSRLPAAFTPKSEIAGWPLIGPMCKLAGCIFIDRRPSKTIENKMRLEEAGKQGDIISLFAEGTTNEGKSILPFRSSYFSLAEGTDITVQALSVVYTHLNGNPVNAAALPIIGWYGDMLFFPHLAVFLKQKSVDVTLIFHEPVTGTAFASRKELAAHCHKQVESAFDFSNLKA